MHSAGSSTARRKVRGFTLIELMIVVAVIAILMAIVLPSYRTSILKTNRADAKSVLMEEAQYMDRYYTTNGSFTAATPTATISAFSPKNSAGTDIRYNITSTIAASTFTLTATPANFQTGDSCGTLTLTNTGAQTPATAGCW